MRTPLIVWGIILLVIGSVLYYNPTQTIGAQTGTAGTQGSDVRDSYATFNAPLEWSLALMVSGGLLLFFGLVIPAPKGPQGLRGPRGSRGRVARRYPSYSRRAPNRMVTTKSVTTRTRR